MLKNSLARLSKKGSAGIWIFFVIVFVLAVFILAFFFIFDSSPKQRSDVVFGERAFKQKNASICLEMNSSNGEYSNECFRYIANKTSDVSLCNDLPEGFDYQCIHSFFTVRWCRYGEIPCSTLQTRKEKNDCYRIIACAKNDISFCENLIVEESDRESLGGITFDNGTTVYFKDVREQCVYSVAEQSGSTCEYIDQRFSR